MKTPHVPKPLQDAIRKHFADKKSEWPYTAMFLGITLKSLQYQLNPALGRETTFHFVGLLAVQMPVNWSEIRTEAKQ